MKNKPAHQILTAEVVSIGDEMTSGARLDTNAQWLSQRLGELGVLVTHHSTVADTLADNIDLFRIATARADIVVSTGGLGPTRDDLTREAIAAMAGVPLQFCESAFRHIESLFARRQRDMPPRNRSQAMFPQGSDEIFNPQGTAPGIDLSVQRAKKTPSRIYALPGVPAEMKQMFDDTVAPRILKQSGGANQIRHLVMKFFGVGESDMEDRLGELISRDRQPRVGITVAAATISLRITATGETVDECDALIAETRAGILQCVGDLHFGDGETFEQQHAVDAMLRARGESLMLIELGRAAPLGDWFAALGESPSFRGGMSLGGRDDLLHLSGCDSLSEALLVFRDRFDADWLLLVDRYPSLVADGPVSSDPTSSDPASGDDDPAEVEMVVLRPDATERRNARRFAGHPDILQQRIGKSAMALLRTAISQCGSS